MSERIGMLDGAQDRVAVPATLPVDKHRRPAPPQSGAGASLSGPSTHGTSEEQIENHLEWLAQQTEGRHNTHANQIGGKIGVICARLACDGGATRDDGLALTISEYADRIADACLERPSDHTHAEYREQACKGLVFGFGREWKRRLLQKLPTIGNRNSANDNGEHATQEQTPFDLTDDSLAQQFAAEYHTRCVYVRGMGWYEYCGTHWVACEKSRKPVRRVAEMLTRRAQSVRFGTHADRETLSKRILSLRSSDRLASIARLAESYAAIDFSDLDADPYLLNCANGTLDLQTGVMRAHDPHDAISMIAPFDYDADASCPRWLELLELYSNTNDEPPRPDWIDFVQQVFGYGLIGENLCESIVFFEGSGGNGKSVLMSTVAAVLGTYAGPLAADVIEKEGVHTSALGSLASKRFVFTTEIDARKPIQANRLKKVCSHEAVSVQFRMGGEYGSFKPVASIVMSINGYPKIADGGRAIRRRVRVVPFDYEQPMASARMRLDKELVAHEASGVLAWLVRGAQAFIAGGGKLPEAACVQDATTETLDENDPIALWRCAQCIQDASGEANFTDLWQSYQQWCVAKQIPIMTRLGAKNFAQALRERGFGFRRSNGSKYTGWKLKRTPATPIAPDGSGRG